MRRLIARHFVRKWGREWNYDTTYLEHLLDEAPATFFRFLNLMKLSRHAEAVPPGVKAVASLEAALAEDCGPCVQLMVVSARKAGVPADQLSALLQRDTDNLEPDLNLASRFAAALLSHDPAIPSYRDAVRARWGEKGVIDLSMAAVTGRVFPALKFGLGFAEACHSIEIDGKAMEPRKAA